MYLNIGMKTLCDQYGTDYSKMASQLFPCAWQCAAYLTRQQRWNLMPMPKQMRTG